MRIIEDPRLLDALPLEVVPLRRGELVPCYPFPQLKLAGTRTPMTFRTVVLENAWVRITIALDLGGRVVEIIDLRTGADVFAKLRAVDPQPGGFRGAQWMHGIEWIAGPERGTALAPVRFQVHEDSGVVLYDLDGSQGIATHAAWELIDDMPRARVALRAQNVALQPRPLKLGLRLPPFPVVIQNEIGVGLYDPERDAGLVIHSAPGEIAHVQSDELEVCVHTHVQELAPWETVSTELLVTPISGIGNLVAFGPDAALGLTDEFIRMQAHRQFAGEKLFLRNEAGNDLEAPLDVRPPIPFAARREGSIADPSAIALRDLDGSIHLQWPSPTVTNGDLTNPVQTPVEWSEVTRSRRSEAQLRRFGKHKALTPISRILLAGLAARDGHSERAMQLLDEALERDASNAIAWWLKAVMRRRWSEGGDESPELLNAHYLAPLDPMLRAEAFLSQGAAVGKEASPTVAPLADDPDALVLPAVLLIEFGLDDEAARWIDEALRHRDEPRLHYLAAWRLLEDSRMAAEAAEHVRRAEASPIQPPFPWHECEKRGISALAARFPDASRLAEWHLIVGANR